MSIVDRHGSLGNKCKCPPAFMGACKWGIVGRGEEGAAAWGHMKVSCSTVSIPSIHRVHRQLSQGWGTHVWDKVL